MTNRLNDDAVEPDIEEIATSSDNVYDAMLSGTLDCMTDLVERVADTGTSCLEREIEFAGQTWTVTVKLQNQ